MQKLVIIALIVATVLSAPTVEQVQECQELNVIKQCPTLETVCNNSITEFKSSLKSDSACKSANEKLDGLPDDGTFPSDDFEKCYDAIEPKEHDEHFIKWYFNPMVNCAKYGNPYHKGSDSKQYKIDKVAQCQATKKECDTDMCVGGCENAWKQFKTDFKNKCTLPKANFDAIILENDNPRYPYSDLKVTYPFSLRSCNASLNLSDNEEFNQVYQCWQSCAQPDDEFDGDESSQILSVCVFALVALLGAVL